MNKRPVGIYILSAILIVTSIATLYGIHQGGLSLYKQVNHEWPETIIQIRFIGSYLFRTIGLIGGIGLFLLNNSVRRFFIGFSWYCILTLPLRHTYQGLLFHTEPFHRARGSVFSLATFNWIAVLSTWTVDLSFSAIVIYYLTRPKVIAHFLPSSKIAP